MKLRLWRTTVGRSRVPLGPQIEAKGGILQWTIVSVAAVLLLLFGRAWLATILGRNFYKR